MLITIQSVLPIFVIILVGNLLSQTPLFTREFWIGLERLGFYLLYPTLLFSTIFRADFSGLSLDKVIFALGFAWFILGLITLLLWPLIHKIGVKGPTFSSIFQSTMRWNGFIALVVAENMFPPEGAAVVALVMAAIVIPINVSTVAVVAWFTDSKPSFASVLKRVAVNPLIIGASLGLLLRLLPGGLPDFVMDGLHLVSRAALGMGLLTIGAGLRLRDVASPGFPVLLPTFLKLILFPAIVVSSALMFGIEGAELSYVALCAAVPTAMNGYVLARQMGGDAENYAITVTLQTLVSLVTIPAVLTVTVYATGG